MNFTQSLLYMIKASSWFSKFTLLLLFLLSIYSLAIIINRFKYYKNIIREKNKIFRLLKSNPGERVITFSKYKQNNPFYTLLTLFKSSVSSDDLRLRTSEMINDFITSEENRLTWLATTSSVSPFIGLLGTVVGITRAFWSIGLKGSASLLVLAPGLAEALITTIAGLTVAIPTMIAYNYFLGKLNYIENALTNLGYELLSLKTSKTDE